MLSRDLASGEMDFIIAFCGIDHPPISYDTAMTLFGITELQNSSILLPEIRMDSGAERA